MAPMKENEWTLMFYFASDTPLAPEIVTQLKSLKQAGFHPDANVIAHFDPNPENAETHIFDINRINKRLADYDQPSKIGFVGHTPNDPFVVNLMTDKLWRKEGNEGQIRQQIIDSLKEQEREKEDERGKEGKRVAKKEKFDPPVPPPFVNQTTPAALSSLNLDPQETLPSNLARASMELPPQESLTNFLSFCRKNYPARHYMLFILGHGIVVGNDTFLFDEHATEHSLNLQPLGVILSQFNKDIKNQNPKSEFELVSFHSCSMSSAEVVFELEGTANYLLASQSPSFVGSWPYRQILIRIFNYLDRKEDDVRGLVTNILHYCLYNCLDFFVAGYSCDAALCDLNCVSSLRKPVSDLSAKLIRALKSKDPQTQAMVRERILLAHLDAQSYFNENYSDLYDFCFRLQQRLQPTTRKKLPTELQQIHDACQVVLKALQRGVEGDDKNRLIIRSDFVGPAYQYSHGLSIYFPWFKPLKNDFWPREYNKYKFIEQLGERKKSWSSFLETYFETTRRHTRLAEFEQAQKLGLAVPGTNNEQRPTGDTLLQSRLVEGFSTVVFNDNGQLGKPGPDSSQGAGCDCQSIKNHPPFTRELDEKEVGKRSDVKIPTSVTLLNDPSFETNNTQRSFVLDGLIK